MMEQYIHSEKRCKWENNG